MPIQPLSLLLLLLTGFVAGLVDAVAGGGGLVTLPALLSLGLPPKLALGTNKLQSSFGSFTATWNYARARQVDLRDGALGVALTCCGATAGAMAVQRVQAHLLEQLIPVALLAILLYALFTPKIGLDALRPRLPRRWFYTLFGLGLGFYDGFFGPGTGSFWMVALMAGLGLQMTRAVGYTKLMNFSSNVTALIWFGLRGQLAWPVGLVMACGQIGGARVGSGLVLWRGAPLVRPVFLLIVAATVLKLLVTRWA
ncbi:MAG: TSUP family transporter [Proteobacteria bacterium]|nr:TSUP family transporter [Pseudomonadota bacterium]